MISQRYTRPVYMGLGFLCVGLGLLGTIVPGMPTTIFLILAVSCFSRSDERMELWLLDHPRFGPTLRDWKEHRSIRRKTKIVSITMVAVMVAVSAYLIQRPIFQEVLLLVGALVCAYIATRKTKPEPVISLDQD